MLSMWPWVEPYFTRRLLEKRTSSLPTLHSIRCIAERFAENNDKKYQSYALKLLSQASTSPPLLKELILRSRPDKVEDTELAWLVITILLKKRPEVQPWWNIIEVQGTALGCPFRTAVQTRNYSAIDRLITNKEGAWK